MTWLIHMCDMTYLYVWHDAFMCDMTHSYAWHDAFICTGLYLCTKQKCRDLSVAKVFVWTQNYKFENFMQCQWSEEKFLEGSVRHQIRLCLWNKCQIINFFLSQLASYRHMLARELQYQLQVWNIWFFSQISWYWLLIPYNSFMHSIVARQLHEYRVHFQVLVSIA